ncbi:MAG: hypothetical protein WC956_03260 [bacterium]
MTTRKTTDLYVTTTNEMGTLSRLTTQLKMNNVNIESFVAWEEGNKANFRFVTSDNNKAKDLWTKAGYTVKEDPVVLWTTKNTPGMLHEGTTAIAEAKINTICNYASTTKDTGTTTVVFYTNNPDRTYDVLNKLV